MATLIVCVGMSGIQINSTQVPYGQYLKAFDPDFKRGVGIADWTHDRTKAKRFPDAAAALAEWKRPSKVMPIRSDGKPNRPLTAYSITLMND